MRKTEAFSIAALESAAATRKPGYVDEVLRCAEKVDRESGVVVLSASQWWRIKREYSFEPPSPRTIGLTVLVSDAQRSSRNAVCVGPPKCEYASHVENGLVRQCSKCGCGGMMQKIAMQETRCPMGKW